MHPARAAPTMAAETPRDVPQRRWAMATRGDRATPRRRPTARRVSMSGAIVATAQAAEARAAAPPRASADAGSTSTTVVGTGPAPSPSPDAALTVVTVGAGGCDPWDPRAPR